MFVTRPNTSVRVEKKPFLVFLADVVVEVLCETKLTMKLQNEISHLRLLLGRTFLFMLTCSKETP